MPPTIEVADDILDFVNKNPAVKVTRTFGKFTPVGIAIEAALLIHEANKHLEPRADRWEYGTPGGSYLCDGCHSTTNSRQTYNVPALNTDLKADPSTYSGVGFFDEVPELNHSF